MRTPHAPCAASPLPEEPATSCRAYRHRLRRPSCCLRHGELFLVSIARRVLGRGAGFGRAGIGRNDGRRRNRAPTSVDCLGYPDGLRGDERFATHAATTSERLDEERGATTSLELEASRAVFEGRSVR